MPGRRAGRRRRRRSGRRSRPTGGARASPTGRIRASGSTCSCRRGGRSGSSSTCMVGTGVPSTAPTGRTSPPGRSAAAGRWRSPATRSRPRSGSPRSPGRSRWRSRPRRRRWRGRSASSAIPPAGTWWRGRSAPTAGYRSGRAGAGRAGHRDQRRCTTCGHCCASTLNDTLRLDDDEAAAESPALRAPWPGARIRTWVGGIERPEFQRQSALLANIWTGVGAEIATTVAPGRHHFDVIGELEEPGSALVGAVLGEAQ